MSRYAFCCTLCGHSICKHEAPGIETWLHSFRGLYDSSAGPQISGISLHPFKLSVPLDYDSVCTVKDCTSSECKQLNFMYKISPFDPIAFAFHASCWSLLEQYMHPGKVPLARLFKLCRSIRIRALMGSLDWSDDFGKLYRQHDLEFYSWEDIADWYIINFEVEWYARADPLNIPEVSLIIEEASRARSERKMFRGENLTQDASDCFGKLPWEICEMIAANLPTIDILNIRRVSKLFGPIITSQRFWASRFGPLTERDHIFELGSSKVLLDWKLLYRLSSEQFSSRGMLNRKRVWKLIQLFLDLLKFEWGPSNISLIEESVRITLDWRYVNGLIIDDDSQDSGGFLRGCRHLYKQEVILPETLTQIECSFVKMGNKGYLSGLALKNDQGANIQLGYTADPPERTYKFRALRGFQVGVAPEGLRAIRVISIDNEDIQWLGDPCGLPVTQRLIPSSPIIALSTGCDEFKMVSLGTATCLSSDDNTVQRKQPLQEMGLWHPSIPDQKLFLRDHYGEEVLAYEYLPLFWCSFGGHGGSYLQHLIAVFVRFRRGLVAMDFSYDIYHVPAQCKRLGLVERLDDHVLHFPIDGPCGERIKAVEISLDESRWRKPLQWIKITTNWGRSADFKNKRYTDDGQRMETLKAAPGCIITGFYAHRSPRFLIDRLGIISEKIETEVCQSRR